jgi:hypothetical protein
MHKSLAQLSSLQCLEARRGGAGNPHETYPRPWQLCNKWAKTLDVTIPLRLLARADEVIE